MRKFAFIIFVMISLSSIAQNTMYYMETLPQNIFYNPALIPDARFSISLPGIGGVSVKGYNSGFTYGEFDHFYDNLGREGYDPDEFINSIGDYNEFLAESRVNLFTIGFRLKDKGYFSFFSHVHNFVTLNAESDVAYLLADLDDLSEDKFPLTADDIDLMTNTYMTVGFTYSRKIKNLTVGISPKLNSSLVGVKSDNISYSIEIDPESGSERDYNETYHGEAIVGLPFEINPAAIVGGVLDTDEDIFPDNWEDELKISDFFNSTSLSVDLGATYTLNRWFFSASLLNLGATKWKTYGYRLYGDEETINVNEDERIKLKLPAKIYLGAKYQFSPKWNCGFLFHNTFYPARSNASATLSLNGEVGKILSTSFSYTAGNTYNNLGLGFRLRFLPGTDLFVVTDNLIQTINLRKAYAFSVAAGINFSFGLPDDKSPL